MPQQTSCYNFSSAKVVQLLSTLLVGCLAVDLAVAEDAFSPLELGQVKVGGEIGRRIDVTIENNLLVIPGNVFSRRDTHFRISYAADNAVIDRGIEVLRRLAEERRDSP